MTLRDAETIAAGIDIDTSAGWNLRAALLISTDGGYPWASAPDVDGLLARAVDLGLMFDGGGLTQLGREVAEQLRPLPWHWDEMDSGGVYLIRPNSSALQLRGALLGEAERIAALLTKADADEAKRYRTG
jgi:hypothetical protein